VSRLRQLLDAFADLAQAALKSAETGYSLHRHKDWMQGYAEGFEDAQAIAKAKESE
jgi:hypothetical protein